MTRARTQIEPLEKDLLLLSKQREDIKTRKGV